MSEDKKNKKLLDEDAEESIRKKNKKSKKEIDDKPVEKSEELDESVEETSEKKKHKKDKKKKKGKEKEREEVEEEKKVENVEESPKNKKSDISEEDKKVIETQVHTANNWEEADLGTDQRKLKFLKLMGAFKHKSDQDVAHKHARAATETQKIVQDLEKQFNEGIQHKFQARHHTGLGFHGEEPKKKPEKKLPESKHITFDDEDDEN
ncbi:unnamed protein product [Brachionus calyciflorus]|uniref:Small acidic protein n=1 Tax=Brachionus calyciflorus TaxID=104777 RepID=A0A813NIR2_9BILA|nr:unnamed protein product [Brachionus calyciflorus]